MKQIIIELNKAGISFDRFIIPYVNEMAIKYKGVGIFPDRLIFKSQNGDFQKLVTAKENAIDSFVLYFSDDYPSLKGFLDDYLRIHIIEKQIPDGANIIEEIFKHLNTLELQNIPLSDKNAKCEDLFKIFNNINTKRNDKKTSFFQLNNYQKDEAEYSELGLKDANGNIRFESIAEIATAEIKNSDDQEIRKKYKQLVNKYLWYNDEDKDSDGDFIKALKEEFTELFKPYHKYIAIIKADGDKIGSTIESLKGDIVRLRKFSEGLLNWAFETDKAVRKFGAVPIYIGGDDLLLFAPIAYKGKNIIDLIEKIDDCFKKALPGFDGVSLSYGVSITYFKFPMFEAIGKVDNLLKQAKEYSEDRNAVCIRVLKHSGSVFEATFTKGRIDTKTRIQELLECFNILQVNKERSFLNSVGYFLRDNKELVKLILNDPKRLKNFFANNFDDYVRDSDLKAHDEKIEKQKPKAEYLRKVEELLSHISQYSQNSDDVLQSVYSIIRIVRFLKGQEDEK